MAEILNPGILCHLINKNRPNFIWENKLKTVSLNSTIRKGKNTVNRFIKEKELPRVGEAPRWGMTVSSSRNFPSVVILFCHQGITCPKLSDKPRDVIHYKAHCLCPCALSCLGQQIGMPMFSGLTLKSVSGVVDRLTCQSFRDGPRVWVHKVGPGSCTCAEHLEIWELQFLGTD